MCHLEVNRVEVFFQTVINQTVLKEQHKHKVTLALIIQAKITLVLHNNLLDYIQQEKLNKTQRKHHKQQLYHQEALQHYLPSQASNFLSEQRLKTVL